MYLHKLYEILQESLLVYMYELGKNIALVLQRVKIYINIKEKCFLYTHLHTQQRLFPHEFYQSEKHFQF